MTCSSLTADAPLLEHSYKEQIVVALVRMGGGPDAAIRDKCVCWPFGSHGWLPVRLDMHLLFFKSDHVRYCIEMFMPV